MSIQRNEKQNLDQIYLAHAGNTSLWDLKPADFLRSLCKSIADSINVGRVAVYVLNDDDESLTQENIYIADKDKHYSGIKFNLDEFPILLEPLNTIRIEVSPNSPNNSRLIELRDSYIIPLNIGASMYCSLHNAGKFIGAVSVEHIGGTREWSENEKRFLTSVSDLIAQRLNTARVLEAEEERYRAVFENSSDGMFLMRNNVCIDCNAAAETLFDHKREDILQKTPLYFSPEHQPNGQTSRDFGREKIRSALQGKPQSFEFTYIRANNQTFPADVKLSRFEIRGQTYLMTVVRDISRRKTTEEKVLEKNKYLALMNDLFNKLQSTSSVDDIYQHTLEELVKMPHLPGAAIFNVDAKKKSIQFNKALGYEKDMEQFFSYLPYNEELQKEFVKTGKAVYFSDLHTDQRVPTEFAESLMSYGIMSMIEIPFIVNNDCIAVLFLTYNSTHAVNSESLEVLLSISKTVSLALENAYARSKLDYMAHHDSLTGLSNRVSFHKEFKQRKSQNAALYLLDLDRFKEINDTLGHFTGDKVLQQLGSRLESIFQNHEHIVSRLGGDEFIILVYDIQSDKDAKDIAQVILECLRKPFELNDLILEIDASIGVAIYPQDGKNSHELLRSADVAMYQAKQTKNGFTLYQQHLDIHTPERLTMIAELGSFIQSGQLVLHYQPKICLRKDKVLGFEALARWNHPRLGLLGPGNFIPLIEMSNTIFQLTEAVLHQALAQQQQWLAKGLNYTVAVNLSTRNLIDDRIIGLLKEMLDYYGTPKNMLELEITETSLMHDAYRATNYLQQISDLGIQLSIDDFGTGYSSLAYLNKLPIHKLKLDREFVMDMLDNKQGENIVKTIIALSNTLDLDIVAEGVEDKLTLEKLKEMQCDEAQGYFICKPNSWDNIEKWLNEKSLLH